MSFLQRLTILLAMVRRCFFIAIPLLVALLLLAGTGMGLAASTVDCHCFRDRSFSPEKPAAFDPYLLATVQNRLLSYAFAVPRKDVVSEKMSGVSGESLWVAHWLARSANLPVAEIQNLYAHKGSWRAVVTQKAIDPELLGSRFVAALLEDGSEHLAWVVVSEVLGQSLAVSVEDFMAFRQQGASLKEAILAHLIALQRHAQAQQVLKRARQNGNWGSVSIASGITVEDLESLLAASFPGNKH